MFEGISLFKNLNLDEYRNDFIIKSYKKNDIIFHEDDECLSLGIIISGEIKISTITYLGNEYTIKILHQDEIFGETLLFSDSNNYLGNGISLKDTVIIFIKKSVLLRMLENKIFITNYLHLISINTSTINQRLKLFSQKTIEDKILFYLSSESKRLNTNKIPIDSKESLANVLNIPRPSLSRELINLKNKGIIDYSKYYILIK